MAQRPGHHPPKPFPGRRYLGVVAFLVLAMAATLGLRAWGVAHVAATAQAQQEAAVAEALAYVTQQFGQMQQALLAQGKALAGEPEVVRALRERLLEADDAGTEPLVRRFAALTLPERWAVELYDPALELVAWNGYSLPLDEAPAGARFLQTFQTAVAEDGGWRQALVVWVPVRDGARALGAVRVMRLLHAHTPVRNQYLRDYSVGEVWRRATGLPVTAQFERPLPNLAPAQGQARLLQGLDGTLLGRVVVEPPEADALVAAARTRYNDVLAFWMTLLLFWLVAALWTWYRASGRAARLALAAFAWWGVRYALLAIDVPARWQRGKAPFSPLFDPTHLASTLGGGLMRSSGDLFITVLFAFILALALLDFAGRFRRGGRSAGAGPPPGWMAASPLRVLARLPLVVLPAFGLTLLLSVVTRHAVLDSTFDFFTREGLFPKSLVLLIFFTLLLAALAGLVLIVALAWLAMRPPARPEKRAWPAWALGLGAALAATLPLVLLYAVFGAQRLVPWPMAGIFLAVGFALAAFGPARQGGSLGLLTLRGVLTSIFLTSILLYPMFYSGLGVQRSVRMQDAAESFGEGRDPRVLFAIRHVLEEARLDPTVGAALADTAHAERRRAYLDSLSMVLLRGSLLSSLSAYDVSLLFLDAEGRPAGRYDASDQNLKRAALDQIDHSDFGFLRQMYYDQGSSGVMIEQMTGRLASDRHQYAGVAPLPEDAGGAAGGWIMARAEPHSLLQEGDTPFLRALLPAGYSNLYANLSMAEFNDGVLVRSFGDDFGRYRLDAAVRKDLMTRPEGWYDEKVKERRFLTYYRRARLDPDAGPILAPVAHKVIAVRVPALTTFDHLYYLLRLTVAGLFVGVPFYGLGLYLRRRAGLLPAPRVRFRDKVLNAFLVVGIIAVTAVGFLGVSVVTGENERAVQSWLRQHLERVEETLALDAQGDEMSYRVLERTPIDSLAARAGLDLNVYEAGRLLRYSRPQLVRERLIDVRLPVQAYQALYLDGYQFTFVEERLGTFTYTAGYRALLDEQGQPAFVVSVPTLPEQERIEEERARTVAYLFGALLLLVVLVMGTASLLANALSRPIARLRVGLEEVARGHFERKLPVDTRDEIGELVQTFNVMQEQLSESRRKLAQQERQLAWREMARQVAHEIKNPLTPMKLSVQHLRRAFEDAEGTGDGEAAESRRNGRFARLFERITGTLVEQIDTLARIANEFSSFARLPTRLLERLDLNEVVREAVSLMQAEAGAEIELDLTDEPLVLEADREEVRRIYINLLKNALQALPTDRPGRVAVSTRRQPAQEGRPACAYSTVADNGLGIPKSLHDRIFEPNFSTKTSGAGLGLAIARRSIEELDGQIGFETEEGRGTTFWVCLPLMA